MASPQVLDAWLIQAEDALASHSREHSENEGSTTTTPSEQNDLLGEILATRALLAPFLGDAQAALALCEQALLLLAVHNLAARQFVTYARVLALGALGEMVPTHAYLQLSAYEQSLGHPWAAIEYLAEAAIRAIWQGGRLHEAWGLLEEAVVLGNEGSALPYPVTCNVYAWQAVVLREWNRLDEALDCAQQAIQMAEQIGDPRHRLSAYGSLLRVALSRGELQQARAALERAESAAREVSSSFIQAFLITVEQVRFLLASGELERAALFAERLRNAEQPLVPLAREREAVALARVWLAQERPEEVLSLLVPLLEMAIRQERWGNVIELRLLAALASQVRSEEQQALTQLSEAVQLAQSEGYIRCFVDEGDPMAALLSTLRDRQRKRGPTPYLDTLLAAFPPARLHERGADQLASHSSLQQPLLDSLSKRELEVLRLLAVGTSNQEIAEILVITLDTVKRHVSNILSKLGVSNRTQAVSRASELGLLHPERQHPFYGYTPSS
jgi:LuxR family maltose regulon positive regulatory protein